MFKTLSEHLPNLRDLKIPLSLCSSVLNRKRYSVNIILQNFWMKFSLYPHFSKADSRDSVKYSKEKKKETNDQMK